MSQICTTRYLLFDICHLICWDFRLPRLRVSGGTMHLWNVYTKYVLWFCPSYLSLSLLCHVSSFFSPLPFLAVTPSSTHYKYYVILGVGIYLHCPHMSGSDETCHQRPLTTRKTREFLFARFMKDFHNIFFNRCKNHFCKLLNVHEINNVTQTEIHAAEPSSFDVKIAIVNLERCIHEAPVKLSKHVLTPTNLLILLAIRNNCRNNGKKSITVLTHKGDKTGLVIQCYRFIIDGCHCYQPRIFYPPHSC
jgi:hypothetical protein